MLTAGPRQAEETLKGEPRSVRVFRQEHVRYLEIETTYDRGNRPSARVLYRTDGTISRKEVFEYADEGRFITVKLLDGEGNSLGITEMSQPRMNVRERRTRSPEGEEVEHSISELDSELRVISSSSINHPANLSVKINVRYDAEGALESGTMTSGPMRVEFRAGAEKRLVAFWYGEDGEVLASFDAGPNTALTELVDVWESRSTGPIPGRREEVESRDRLGNWTQKSVYELDPRNNPGKPTTVLTRLIEYY